MAPLKFEEKIKEKLEKRALRPSENSWEQLASTLDKQSQKKENKKIWLYSVAAIFIGVLVVGSVLRNRYSVSEQLDTQFVDRSNEVVKRHSVDVVESNTIEQKTVKEKVATSQKVIKNKEIDPTLQENTVAIKRNVSLQESKPEEAAIKHTDKEIKHDAVVLANSNTNKVALESKEKGLVVNTEIVKDKVTAVVAQIKELQKNNVEVTDSEIDKLLRKAQREITTQEILKSNTVSASALLQDVEEQIDETFKQRVFEALKAGFQKVKTAVAEREN